MDDGRENMLADAAADGQANASDDQLLSRGDYPVLWNTGRAIQNASLLSEADARCAIR